MLLIYGGLLGFTWWRFVKTPKGFIPSQDMGYLMVNIQLPDSASSERTQEVVDHRTHPKAHPGIKHCSGISGQSFVLNAFGSNFGSMFVNLQDYGLRLDPNSRAMRLPTTCAPSLAGRSSAQHAVFPPPPIRGVAGPAVS